MKRVISALGVIVFCLFTFVSVPLAQHSHGVMSVAAPMNGHTGQVVYGTSQLAGEIRSTPL
jgi:hypothetical protein